MGESEECFSDLHYIDITASEYRVYITERLVATSFKSHEYAFLLSYFILPSYCYCKHSVLSIG